MYIWSLTGSRRKGEIMGNKYLIIALLMLVLAVSLSAQTLSVDKNGVPIQAGRTFSTLTMTCSADTLWNKVEVPPGTYSVWLLPSNGLKVSADSTYTNPATDVSLTDSLAVELPVLRKTQFWIRRASAGTAASAYMIFKRM